MVGFRHDQFSSQSWRAATTVGTADLADRRRFGSVVDTNQRAERGPDRVGEGVEVVPALEHDQQAARRYECGESSGEVGVVGRRQLDPRQGIVAVSIEAGGDDQPVGRERLDHRHDHLVERGPVHVASRAGRERQVQVGSGRLAPPGLGEPSGARVQRRLVGRHVQDARVVVEDVLGAVAVVDVPVDDRHPLTVGGQLRGADRGVVEQAEPHRPVGEGVMPGRPGRRERDVALARRGGRRSKPAPRPQHGGRWRTSRTTPSCRGRGSPRRTRRTDALRRCTSRRAPTPGRRRWPPAPHATPWRRAARRRRRPPARH